ncbi:hypothetical protein C9F11_08815 [Streptomyces sp. YIM 121038]|uniref:hypothetical protein n=1 Tax=Streptomyces sp. YIM 121038 TaxID=2136401 RepID=UPI0011103078|nr:hypothetical protein [Streptomyces sp. YIM 121038]QCX75452.1 hypothetical protein C9F11_08815 [Streptomyces sp. YIM 121038]
MIQKGNRVRRWALGSACLVATLTGCADREELTPQQQGEHGERIARILEGASPTDGPPGDPLGSDPESAYEDGYKDGAFLFVSEDSGAHAAEEIAMACEENVSPESLGTDLSETVSDAYVEGCVAGARG